ncbi:MAG: hypothetical protein R3B45_12960 [Bdellovibrionota bacterium]
MKSIKRQLHIKLIFATCMLLSYCQQNTAYARVLSGILGGYSYGTLTRKTSEAITAAPTQLYVAYLYKNIGAHAFFQHTSLDYIASNEHYKGIYSFYGVGLNASALESTIGQASIFVQMPLSSSYVVLSESKGTIKDQNYIYSTLITLTGSQGFQAAVGYDFMTLGRLTSKAGGKSYVGLYAAYLSQNFSSQSIRIKTNNSKLSPISPGTEKVSYSLNMASILAMFSFSL